MKKYGILLLSLMWNCSLWGMGGDSLRYEEELRVMFYNCENLFDTEDNPETQDDEFTPEGVRHWTSYRLYQKLQRLSQVVMAVGEGRAPAIVGLAEVENDSVMRRLKNQDLLYKSGYRYVITHSRDARGINVALMYQPDDFRLYGWEAVEIPLPEESKATRPLLHAWGRLVGGDTLDVVVCHLPSQLGGKRHSAPNRKAAHAVIRHVADSLQVAREHLHLLIMGDMNDDAADRQLQRDMRFGERLQNLMRPLSKEMKRGKSTMGSHKYQGRWSILDQIWVNDGLLHEEEPESRVWLTDAEVVCLPFLLTEDVTHLGHRPLRTYYGYRYEGGFSDHLPVRAKLHVRW